MSYMMLKSVSLKSSKLIIMSNHSTPSGTSFITKQPIMKPMRARLKDEAHRVSTPLELFFDLVFVVAVALAAAGLHHGIIEHHISHAIVSYTMLFFAIWWAWMNFSWFASAYDVDDVPYRLLIMVQLTGTLLLAAGVQPAFDHGNWGIMTAGYVIMRLSLIALWTRAWHADVERRKTIVRYMMGLFMLQVAWSLLLWIPSDLKLFCFMTLAIGELLVPIWAESAGITPFHPHHIVERFGLFTIIVLGESILAASTAMQAALAHDQLNTSVLKIGVGGVLIVFSMWWTYFYQSEHDIMKSVKTAFLWSYGHFLIFASAAAVGAGLAVSVDSLAEGAEVSSTIASLAVIIPVIIFNVSVAVVHGRIKIGGPILWALFIVCILSLITAFFPDAILFLGMIWAIFLGFKLYINRE
jgi:low temperature requirement protein LtrA